jgi:hypothetical protein
MPDDNKAIIASSEFDPAPFIKGIDAMTSSLERLSAQEDKLRGDISNTNTALAANNKAIKQNQDQINALDKTAADYTDQLAQLQKQQAVLNDQQKALQGGLKGSKEQLVQVNQSANDLKTALVGISAVSKQVTADTKGRTLFDVASMNQQIKDIQTIGMKYRDIFKGKIDNSELDALEDKLAGAKDDFEQLREVVEFTEQQLGKLDPNSEAFKDLNQVVEKGKEILEKYGEVTENTGKRSESLTGRLKAIRNELTQMELAGEAGSERFEELTREAADLQDAIDKTGERVRTFANSTRLIGAGVEALRGLAAGYELVAGASTLFGVKNEAAEESIKRLTAIMALANGLQEISNLLKKESVVRIVTEELVTKAYIVTQRILAATLGTTAAASRGLALAITATGIGALVVGIGLLVSALSAWADESKEAAKAQGLLNYEVELGIDFTNRYIEAIADAGRIIQSWQEKRLAQEEKVSRNDRVNLVNRQKNAQLLRDVDIKTTSDQLEEAKKSVDGQREQFVRADDMIREFAAGRLKLSDDEVKELDKTRELYEKSQETQFKLETDLEIKRNNNLRDQAKARTELRKFDLAVFENYAKQLTDLQKRLGDAQNQQAQQNQEQLELQAQQRLKAEQRQITQDVQKGALTSSQGKVLKNLLKQINGVELETEIKEFTRKSIEAATKLEDELLTLRLRAGEQRAGLIGDELDREAAVIQSNFAKETAALQQGLRDALKGNNETLRQGLISPEQAEINAKRIQAIYSQLFRDLQDQTIQAQDALAAKVFQKAQENVSRIFTGVQTFVSEVTTQEIEKLTKRYLAGQISYKKYQQELTKIQEVETQRRIATQLRENEALLKGVQDRILLEKDPTRLQQLKDQEQQLRQTIADLKRQLGAADVAADQGDKERFKQRVDNIAAYATAINNVVQSVVGFWQQANEAEQRSLEKSIALQQTRVDAATRIAERGNAEYLRLEQDRLDALQLKQENAARRQLAINAVLQTSQALTAFISALSQGISTGGPLGGIAIAVAVLGLIASGYAIVNSLQQDNKQTLWEGTKSVELNGAPAGRDTVPAMLTKGEAVIPVDRNKDYQPVVSAIYDRTVPAEELNNFVSTYRANRRDLPTLNHERLSEAADVVVTYDGQLLEVAREQNDRLAENTALLGKVHKQLNNLGINVNVDKNGLAISVLKAITEHNINKKA